MLLGSWIRNRNLNSHSNTVVNLFCFSCLYVIFLSITCTGMKILVTQLCLTLCDPKDYIVHGLLQARILEWIAIPFSRISSQPRDWIQVSCIAGRFFTSWATREAPRILEWVAYPFSRGSSRPRNRTGVSCIAARFFQLNFQLHYYWLAFYGECVFLLG